jgi:hypothetical protein
MSRNEDLSAADEADLAEETTAEETEEAAATDQDADIDKRVGKASDSFQTHFFHPMLKQSFFSTY